MADYYVLINNELIKYDFCGPSKPPEVELSLKDECNHNWKRYEGLIDIYDFCLKCDKKKVIE